MLTQQQKNIKKMIKELGLKYDLTITGTIYIDKNKKIKDIQDLIFYLINYEAIKTGEYTKKGDHVLVYKNGIGDIYCDYKTKRVKIELYKEE